MGQVFNFVNITNLGPKNLTSKKCWVKNIQKIWGQQIWGPKTFGAQKFWDQNIFSKNDFLHDMTNLTFPK